MATRTLTAVPLKRYNQGEYDRLYVLVCHEMGKLVARSHGDRRATKLTAGHLLPWLRTRLLLREGRAGWQIVEAETKEQYGRLAGDVMARLHVLAELVDRFALEGEPDDDLWRAVLLANQLAVGDQLSRLGFVEVLAKTAVAVGLGPELERCVETGEELQPDQPIGWSSVHGGTVGPSRMAQTATEYYQLTDVSSLKLLRLAARLSRLPRLTIAPAAVAEAEWLLLDYFQTQLDRNLKALPALTTVIQ